MAIRHVAVVLNGRAGALLEQSDPGALEAALSAAGLQATFIAEQGKLPERIGKAAKMGAEAVIVAGGDGTVACAAQALAGQQIPLGILPFGTMNLLAKDLGLPIGDLAAAVQVVANGRPRAIDVGEVNGHFFLCASMLGLPVRLGRYREEIRAPGLRNWLRMARAAARLLVRGAPVQATLDMGAAMKAGPIPLKAMTLTITVNALDEASGLDFSRPSLDGGQLCVHVVHPSGFWAYVALIARLIAGHWRQDGAVEEYRTEMVNVGGRTRAMQVMNDGEISLLTPPLQYRIHKTSLLVLAP